MFTEKQIDRYADVLLWALKTARKARFKKNDIVLIRYHLGGLGLAQKVYEKLMGMGINPVVRAELTSNMEQSFYKNASARQLTFQMPGDRTLYENLNGGIYILAPDSITHLSGVDPAKIGKTAVSRKYLRDILTRREEQGLFGWTLCACPTEEQAAHAELTVKEYADQIVAACFLNKSSPVSQWQDIYRQASEIKKWLNAMTVSRYHVSSDRVDLTVTPGEMRKWIGISGHNMPSFELFVSPDWRGTRGIYYADQPSYRSGNYVQGVRLEFKNGNAVAIEAESGADFVIKQLSMDKGANRLGEFSLTDKRFSKINKFMANTLFDENYGGKYGNCHIAVGSSYSDTFAGDPEKLTPEIKKELGFNDSALHWDLVNTENKRVTAHLTTGKSLTLYENGEFKI
jgi:aminopeptidase